MSKNAVVTGAGSGVGRGVAIELARRGWNVALLGRRDEMLKETIAEAPADRRANMHPFAGDVSDATAVAAIADQVLSRFNGRIDAVVSSAGVNVKRRSIAEISLEDYHKTININLTGVFLVTCAFLPAMRKAREGTIVNIGSDAGRFASALAGVAYSASKFAVTGLTQSINAEERANGIRAIAILPGTIDTPILENRPVVPDAAARAKMMRVEDIAACVMLAIELPQRAVIEELLIRPL